ncbi:MAG: ATP-dependent Clp protease adaptor ClpS [Bacteroidales bacterium]|jgi:ATP-dependent Clp protease adaptor protein ClpS|nr:ATP-dependent Clp protease adaptor ClpS [Bacteroidales bacterium]MCU0408788.1 ATP-dependent Clp protease adaptor ClpS [Bacteroidales bacterium]
MKEKELRREDMLEGRIFGKVLMLYNDDFNTFDHVIKSLVEVCGHDSIQAEQCALIVHFRGKCDIKRGSDNLLAAMCNSLILKGLSSEVVEIAE